MFTFQQLKKIALSGKHLRVLVEGGGCSGFQYQFALDNQVNPEDRYIWLY